MSISFYGKRSEHLEEMERKGVHVHEAKPIMYVPYGILASLIVIIGLVARPFEDFLHHKFEPYLAKVVEAHAHNGHATATAPVSPELMTLTVSGIMLLLGGYSAYRLYIRREPSPKELLERYGSLRALHTFLWNRWLINPFYYKLFVDGTLRLKDSAFNVVETKGIDRGLNVGVPRVAASIYDKLRKMQTGVLSYNMLYVVIAFLVVVLILLLGGF
jgi:NADH-quinone oxidoreductase subunit L